jgi:hypothetical protein
MDKQYLKCYWELKRRLRNRREKYINGKMVPKGFSS